MGKKTFAVLFPRCTNVCLIKDVGMIPWVLYKNHQWESMIVSYKNEENYSYLNEIPGVHLEFLNNISITQRDGCAYLLFHARKIDALQLYHPTSPENYIYIVLYKLFNPRGLVFLKIDLDKKQLKDFQYNKKGLKGAIKRKILSYCDIISSETMEIAEMVSREWRRKIEYIPNGYYQKNHDAVNYSQKENIICTVGRIGTYQKATDILLTGYKKYAETGGDWKLRIIGKIEDDFEEYLNQFKKENPIVYKNITFTKNIEDRSLLESEYARAKIFVLSSRYEGAPITYLEAMRNGCYIISSEVDTVNELLQHKYGTVFPIDDSDALAEAFKAITKNEDLLEKNCKLAQEYVQKNYNWNVIGQKINQLLNT